MELYNIKINEIFPSIQGEGRYQGTPVIFVRLSGCNRTCEWCDTKYHVKGKFYPISILADTIIDLCKSHGISTIVFTGGEPLLQMHPLMELVSKLSKIRDLKLSFHLETNGDMILSDKDLQYLFSAFHYICVSPKSLKVAKNIFNLYNSLKLIFNSTNKHLDIKVVTDLNKIGKRMVKYATMLMPLTVTSYKETLAINMIVWNYCVRKGLFFSARLHYLIWGNKKRK